MSFVLQSPQDNMTRAEFVKLPLEIVVHILEQLRARDILAVGATCRRLKFFIDQSSVLQLITELAVQGLRLRTYPPATQPCGLKTMSPAERLDALRRAIQRSTQATDDLAYKFDCQGVSYATQAGLLCYTTRLNGHVSGIVIQSLWEASSEPWRRFDDLGVIIDAFAFDVYEDLLVLISSPLTAGDNAKIHLRSLRTGLDHPRASSATLELFSRNFDSEKTKVLVSGHILIYYGPDYDGWGCMMVWDWTTGEITFKMLDRIGGVAFISTTLLLWIEHNDPDTQSQICIRDITDSGSITLRLALEDDPILYMEHGIRPAVFFMASTPERDTPNLPDDLPLSPYIHDETGDTIVCIYSESMNLFNIVRTRALLSLYEEQTLAAMSTTSAMEKGCESSVIPREEWSQGVAFRIHSEKVQPLDAHCTAISQARLALLGFNREIFLSTPSLQEQEEREQRTEFTDAFVAVLDFNTRPIRLANGKRGEKESDESSLFLSYMLSIDDEKVWHRLVIPPRPISEDQEITMGSSHILTVQLDDLLSITSCSALPFWTVHEDDGISND
ncbi:hypothetical protein PIIN_09334 [Serendipita indica DSM 11827]|uniref:F-box domain-containing protein n=1 Tax=Serendipita indica (strain DSM 11827) TaxID=1109443 RepID=G4TVK7_SERID|nr:hypothetical protein PIIN_09334 [Serendipita indica DSM 11827]